MRVSGRGHLGRCPNANSNPTQVTSILGQSASASPISRLYLAYISPISPTSISDQSASASEAAEGVDAALDLGSPCPTRSGFSCG